MTGRVEQYFETRGFGFIVVEGGSDIYFHASGIVVVNGSKPYFLTGDKVSFDIGEHKGRRIAMNIKKLPN